MNRHEGAQRVVDWMLREGRRNTRMREFGDEMCRRIVEAGFPLMRAFCAVNTLHPQFGGSAYIWRRGQDGATRYSAPRAEMEQIRQGPLALVRRTLQTQRWRLETSTPPLEHALLEEHRAAGGTDYIVMPMLCSNGEMNAISFLTDRPGGFTDGEIAGLSAIADVLGLIVELQSSRRVASILMDTYVGHRSGQRVLSGAIVRGSGEAVRAVIWFCDLRGFTAMADSMPREGLIALLNDYFEIVADAATAEGGEVLKFMGDGMLAIFEVGDGVEPAGLCEAALRAASAAKTAIAARNLERRAAGAPEIRFGLALHLGEVSYGNIGSSTRLDFTVIGPAVNHANRLEELAARLDETIVTSSSFAEALRRPLRSLGLHRLRGVAQPQEVFVPAG